MAKADIFIFLDDVIPSRGASSWVNRTMVSCGGKDRWLTIPLDSRTRGLSAIRDLKSSTLSCGTDFLAKLTQWYPRTTNVDDALHWVSSYEFLFNEHFVQANMILIEDFVRKLEIKVPEIYRSSELGVESAEKNRYLIDLVTAVSGDCYISGQGATAYLDVDMFHSNGVHVEWSASFNMRSFDIQGWHRSFVDLWSYYGLEKLRKIVLNYVAAPNQP